MEKLNINCVEKILEYTAVDQVRPLLDILSIKSNLILSELSGLEYDRLDPRRVFRQLVRDPEELMKVMRECNVVLSGSRAVEYFMPGSCAYESDWDFYWFNEQPDNSEKTGNSCHNENTLPFDVYMETLGIEWENPPEDPGEGPTDEQYDLIRSWRIKAGRLTTKHKVEAKIQLIYVDNKGVLSNIMKFHSTIPQCFLSGSAAVHMYSSLIQNKEYIEWTSTNNQARAAALEVLDLLDPLATNEEINAVREGLILKVPRERLTLRLVENGIPADKTERIVEALFGKCVCKEDSTTKALEKYISRGYKQMSLAHYISKTKRWQTCSNFAHCFRIRYIGDEDSKIISFEDYVEGDMHRALAKEQAERLREFSWYEYPYGTMSTKDATISVLYRTCNRYKNRNPGGL